MNKRFWLLALLLIPLALAVPLYNAASWRPRAFGVHPFPLQSKLGTSVWPQLLLSPDGTRLLTFLQGQTTPRGLAMWDVERGRLLWKKTYPDAFNWNVHCFSPDGQTLVSAGIPAVGVAGQSEPLQVQLINSANGRQTGALATPGDWIRHALFSPDGRKFIIATNKGLNIKNVATHKQLASIDVLVNLRGNGASEIAPAPDGRSFIVNIVLINFGKSSKPSYRAELRNFNNRTLWTMPSVAGIQFDFSPDNSRILIVEFSRLQMRETKTGRILWQQLLAGVNDQAYVWLPDSSAIIVDTGREFQFLNAQTGKLTRSLGHRKIEQFVVAPDGNQLYSIDAQGQIERQRLK